MGCKVGAFLMYINLMWHNSSMLHCTFLVHYQTFLKKFQKCLCRSTKLDPFSIWFRIPKFKIILLTYKHQTKKKFNFRNSFAERHSKSQFQLQGENVLFFITLLSCILRIFIERFSGLVHLHVTSEEFHSPFFLCKTDVFDYKIHCNSFTLQAFKSE